MPKKLLVDLSSLMWTCLSVGEDKENGVKVEHEGKELVVNSAWYGYDNAVNSLVATLEALHASPCDILFVRESGAARERRQQIYPKYKLKKTTRPEQLKANFNTANDMLLTAFRSVGAQSVTQNGVEADDVIAYLCDKLAGDKVVLSNDGDLSQLLSPTVSMWRMGAQLTKNPYGPFDIKYIALYKALVGDSSDNYKGAVGFGAKAWLDLLVGYGNALGALEGMIKRKALADLAEDVAEFKPFQKLIDGAQHVYESHELALLRPEWVNTDNLKLQWSPGNLSGTVEDHRLRRWAAKSDVELSGAFSWESELAPPPPARNQAVFDIELIGKHDPVFLLRYHVPATGERDGFWHFVEGDMARMAKAFRRTDLTWVSFNGINFDAPILSAAIDGKDARVLKRMANAIIIDKMRPWELPERFDYRAITFDHIDLAEVAPGVRISLKAYAGRMGYPTMVDMPFAHDQDLTKDQLPALQAYCDNDLGVTAELAATLRSELELRAQMSYEHGIDLRSKSDAQIAEALMRKAVGVGRPKDNPDIPAHVSWRAPALIKTDSMIIQQLIGQLESTQFVINQASGRPRAPAYLEPPLKLGFGTYQCGVGGLHSTHDKHLYLQADDTLLLSDFDASSYYTNIILKAGVTPHIEGGKGEAAIKQYRKIHDTRMGAKRAGNKKDSGSLKIVLNGWFGKLGSIFSAFYAPDLLLAVTLPGQLNLLCLIHDIEKVSGAQVRSANTDGIAVSYPASRRDEVLAAVAGNAMHTGFEYEETRYAALAMKDVNNYLALGDERLTPVIIGADGEVREGKPEGKVKRKGLYAEPSLMKNPSMNVCTEMAIRYLLHGVPPERSIQDFTDIRDFVAIRAVKGGGVQPERAIDVDDWVLVHDVGTKDNLWMRQAALDAGRSPDDAGGGGAYQRKSRPPPVQIYEGGQPFGRMARWYMSTAGLPPIVYVGSGNKVPKTEGARVCMTLPEALPEDLDKDWYVREAHNILRVLGVEM